MSTTRALTRNQALVLETLTACDEPLSAYAILDRLRGEGVRAPLQVYRALDKLVETGLVHRLDSLKAFVACSHPHEHDGAAVVAFAICENCARVWEFSDSKIEDRFAAWAEAESFLTKATTIEISGLCASCRKAAEAAEGTKTAV
ncbi:Fur family transcriptional regulator [Aurantimonas sp. 22II-16-19i]|uniref:Fur family transcriptional regulator n=1 Tax=Aurantimonas sp. 22II-16-19i TaxID=1317114 RepID=UPI0009F7F7FB|nr:Fur family transcriptional regulator [Aurantimonas sp. 22II-16-19i]ORE90598.1 ferric uptake regulator family protein [Aurantimonas sp. 22II-16-19i]